MPSPAYVSRRTIHGGPSHDKSGFGLERHAFFPGVSIKEQDEAMRTFRVVSVREID